jgi:predicted membrane protein
MIFSYPINIQLIYFALCLVIAIFGINKTMGFWGNLFFSILFSPILGLIVLLVSGGKRAKSKKTA